MHSCSGIQETIYLLFHYASLHSGKDKWTIIFSVKFINFQSSVGKLWDAAGCAASYLLLDPDDDTMIDNLRYFKQELGDQSLKITARKVTK